MIKAILYDMDGTLVETEHVWDKSEDAFLQQFGHHWEPEKYKTTIVGTSLQEGTRLMKEWYNLPGTIDELALDRITRAQKMILSESFMVEGALDFVRDSQKNYKIALATSAEQAMMDGLGARFGFDAIFGEHMYSVGGLQIPGKPHPDIFLYAAQKLGVDPAQCLVIEDSPSGIEAARRAGMKTIAITTSLAREYLSAADRIVDSYSEIDLGWF